VIADVTGRIELPGKAIDPVEEFEAGLDTVLAGIAAAMPR
jgi:hypothetical protein